MCCNFCTLRAYVIPKVYNGEEINELSYTISKMIVSSLSGYYSKFMLMIEVMFKCF